MEMEPLKPRRSLGPLGRHQDDEGRYVSPRVKYREPVSFGVSLDRAELHALRRLAAKHGRSANEIIRGAVLLLLEAAGLHEPDGDGGADAAMLATARRIVNGEED